VRRDIVVRQAMIGRRKFVASTNASLALSVAWRFVFKADIEPEKNKVRHIADTCFTIGDSPDRSCRQNPAWL
jgi:hypothetical protein